MYTFPNIYERRAMEKLLKIGEVVEIVGFKTSTIYKFMKTRNFPKPVKIGRSSRWKLSDVKKWLSNFN